MAKVLLTFLLTTYELSSFFAMSVPDEVARENRLAVGALRETSAKLHVPPSLYKVAEKRAASEDYEARAHVPTTV
jgi:hypothetical protein